MTLPSTMLFVLSRSMITPLAALPEMTLPAPVVVPPIVLPLAPYQR